MSTPHITLSKAKHSFRKLKIANHKQLIIDDLEIAWVDYSVYSRLFM